MAVDAHHLLRQTAGGQNMMTPASHAGWEDAAGGASFPATTYATAVTGRKNQLQLMQGYQYQPSPCVGGLLAAAPAPGPTMTMDQYGQVCAADASESGVTQDVAASPRKRKRAAAEQSQFLGTIGSASGVAAHLQQQQLLDVDRIVLQHTAKMCAELTEQRRRHARQLVAAVEAAAAKRLRAQTEEVERIRRLNWALEERVRGLFVESQLWRDLAQSNEAAANALRGELKQALDTQQMALRGGLVAAGAVEGGPEADDAASCCCGENDVAVGREEDADEVGTTSTARIRRCAVCGEGAAEVLLLPCRHLCACAPCGDAARACPACGCVKNGIVYINFS